MGCSPCCCIPLKTGVSIAANFGTVLSVAKLVLMIIAFSSRIGLHSAEKRREIMASNHRFNQIIEFESEFGEQQGPTTISVIMIAEVILNFINIIVNSLLLLHGVKKSTLGIVYIYFVFEVAFVGLSTVFTNINGFLEIITVEVYAFEVTSHLVYLYFIYVVYCAYLEIMEGSLESAIVEDVFDQSELVPSFDNDDDPTDTRAI
ncbi:unnamed protein product [Orchesella dallaii]|uniref:Uncharacterized protein n=1 Tax=Orchesella dallaii TaxID=48710 RepID=A0ABP1RGG9_9HEXA